MTHSPCPDPCPILLPPSRMGPSPVSPGSPPAAPHCTWGARLRWCFFPHVWWPCTDSRAHRVFPESPSSTPGFRPRFEASLWVPLQVPVAPWSPPLPSPRSRHPSQHRAPGHPRTHPQPEEPFLPLLSTSAILEPGDVALKGEGVEGETEA